jgi:hypothetical protein
MSRVLLRATAAADVIPLPALLPAVPPPPEALATAVSDSPAIINFYIPIKLLHDMTYIQTIGIYLV